VFECDLAGLCKWDNGYSLRKCGHKSRFNPISKQSRQRNPCPAIQIEMIENEPLPAINDLLRRAVSAASPRAILRPLAEVLLWGVVGLAAALSMLALHPASLSNDGYQYLSVAANIRHGNGAATDLVYFDTERSHGRIPAPLTTFPMGYSFAVGMLSSFVGGFETAARILSAICFAGTTALLASVLIAVRINPFVRAVMMLLFAANVVSVSFSAAVATESMFVFIFTAAIAALLCALLEDQHSRFHLPITLAGMTMAGLSYWVRYAGLFLILTVVLYFGIRSLRHRGRAAALDFCATLIPLGLAGALMARNLLLVGNWKGGNEIAVIHPLRAVLADYARAQLHLLSGGHAVKFGVWEGFLLAGSLGLGALLVRVLLRDGLGGGALLPRLDRIWTLPFTCTAVYSVGLFYAGLRTVISFGTRMFLPVLPLYILLFGLALHWLLSRALFSGEQIWLRAALCVFVIGYIGVNARDLNMSQTETRQEYLAGLFAERTADGQLLSDWVNAHVAPAAIIAAQDGQAIGYLLHRRTLGLVESEYSYERWECPEIRTQMNRFGAHYLILYRHPDHNTLLLEESSFAAAAASGQPGCGFVIASENQDVRILEIEPLPGAGGSH